MKIIYNKYIPFKGYKAISMFGLIFVRLNPGDWKNISDTAVTHETIHFRQQIEMLFVFFFLWYIIEYIVKRIRYGSSAYDNISFEREAYSFEDSPGYLEKRKIWAWIKFL